MQRVKMHAVSMTRGTFLLSVPRSLHPAPNTLFAFLTRLFVFLERLSRSTRFLPPGSPIKSLSIPTSIIPPFIDVVFESSRSVKSLTWPPDNRIAPLLDTRRSLVQFSIQVISNPRLKIVKFLSIFKISRNDEAWAVLSNPYRFEIPHRYDTAIIPFLGE